MWGTYALLEFSNLLLGHGICLGNNRDKVDLCMEAAHKLNVELLQAITRVRLVRFQRRHDSRVTSGLDEVEACVNTVVDNLGPVDTVLLLEIAVEAGIDVLDDGNPAGRAGKKRERRSG